MNRLNAGFKRFLTGILAAAMILTLTPTYAFAGEDTDEQAQEITLPEEQDEEAAREKAGEVVEVQAEDVIEETVEDSAEEAVEEASADEEAERLQTDEYTASEYKVTWRAAEGCAADSFDVFPEKSTRDGKLINAGTADAPDWRLKSKDDEIHVWFDLSIQPEDGYVIDSVCAVSTAGMLACKQVHDNDPHEDEDVWEFYPDYNVNESERFTGYGDVEIIVTTKEGQPEPRACRIRCENNDVNYTFDFLPEEEGNARYIDWEEDHDNYGTFVLDQTKPVKLILVPYPGYDFTDDIVVSATVNGVTKKVTVDFDKATRIVTISRENRITGDIRIMINDAGIRQQMRDVTFMTEGASWNEAISGISFYDYYLAGETITLTDATGGGKKGSFGANSAHYASISAQSGYKILSVRAEWVEDGETLSQTIFNNGGLYNFKVGSTDMKIVIKVTNKKVLTFESGFGYMYRVSVGETILSSTDNPYELNEASTTFTLSGVNGYKVLGVYDSSNNNRLDSDAALGVFSVSNAQDLTVKVRTTVEASLSMDSSSDDKTFFAPVFTSGTIQAGSDDHRFDITDSQAIKVKVEKTADSSVDMPDYFDIGGYDYTATVSYRNGNSNVTSIYTATDAVFEIPAEVVIAAQNAGSYLSVKVKATKKTVSISVAEDQPVLMFWYNKEDQTSQTITIKTKTVPFCNDGQDLYIFAEDNGTYRVTGLMAGSDSLSAENEKPENKYGTVFKLPYSLLNKDVVLSATVTLRELTAPGTLTTETENCKITRVDQDTTGKDNTWTVPAGVLNLECTVETEGLYTLSEDSFKLYNSTGENTWSDTAVTGVDFTLSAPTLNKAKNGLVYTLTGPAAAFAGRKLKVTAEQTKRKIAVVCDSDTSWIDADSVMVKQNGMKFEGEKKGNLLVFPKNASVEIDPFTPVVVTAEPAFGFKFSGKAEVNRKSVSAPKGVVTTTTFVYDSLDENGNALTTVTIGTEGILNMLVAFDDAGEQWEQYAVNATIADVAADVSPKIGLAVGVKDLDVAAGGVSVMPKNAFNDGFVTVGNDSIVKIDPAKIKDKTKKTVFKVTINGTDPNDGKKYKSTVSISFRQVISSVTVKGKGYSNGIITQAVGCECSYDIAVDAAADISRLCAVVAEDSADKNATVAIDCAKKKLIVKTYRESFSEGNWQSTALPDTEKTIKIVFREGDPANDFTDARVIEGAGVSVKPVTTDFAQPGISVKNTSDRHFIVDLSAPKSVNGYENLYYVVQATLSAGEAFDGESAMLQEAGTSYIPVGSALASGHKIALTENNAEGDGPKSYDISVRLVQAKNVTATEGLSGFYETGKTKTITQKTKALNIYESKLTLAKKNTAFTKGQPDVLVAVAGFSKNTSYTFINTDPDKTYIADADGNTVATFGAKTETNPGGLVLGTDGLSIYVTNLADIPTGKAKLYVTPYLPNATRYTPATLDLTVKAPINRIVINDYMPDLRLFKQDGKAATFKFTAQTFYDGSGTLTKPASSNVRWVVTDHWQKPLPANSPITINEKNGTLTVGKDYVLSADSAVNDVYVQAIANDYPGNATVSTNTVRVIISNKPLTLSRVDVSLNGKKASADELSGSVGIDGFKLDGATIRFWEDNPADPDFPIPVVITNLAIKVSPAKGLTIEPWESGNAGDIHVTKPGKYTITATTQDGGKNTIKFTLNNLGKQFSTTEAPKIEEESGITVHPRKYMKFYDSLNNPINCGDLTYSVPKGITVDPATGEIVSVSGPGTYKITARFKEGSNAAQDLVYTATSDCEEYKVASVYSDNSNLLYYADFDDGDLNNLNAVGCPETIEVIVNRVDGPFDCNIKNAKLTVESGGRIFSTTTYNAKGDSYIRYAVKPSADTVEMTFSYKKGDELCKETIKVNNTGAESLEDLKELKLSKDCKTEFITDTNAWFYNTLTFDLPDQLELQGGQYYLAFSTNDAYYKYKKEVDKTAYYFLRKEISEHQDILNLNDGNGIKTVSTCATSYGKIYDGWERVEIPAGTYKFDVTLVKLNGDFGSGTYIPVTKPTTISLKAVAPKKLNAKLATTKFALNDSAVPGEIELKLSTDRLWKITEGSVVVYNNNDKGTVSDFTKCFKVKGIGADKKSIILEPTAEALGGHTYSEAERKSGKASVSGWVEYRVIGEDGVSAETKCEMVTLTWAVPQQ